MNYREHRELFQAMLAVAGADGTITRSERGLLEALAERVGVGLTSLNAMIDRAVRERSFAANRFFNRVSDPLKAMELLVGAARMDGEISEEERQLLVRIAATWDIPNDEFMEVFKRGLVAADRLRAERKKA